MNKNELSAAIAAKAGLTRKDAEAALCAMSDIVAESLKNGEKEVEPYKTPEEVEEWLRLAGPKLGFKADFFNVSIKELQFPYGGRSIKLPYASAEGVLQVTDADLLTKPLLRGIGSYRRVGLGLLQLTN